MSDFNKHGFYLTYDEQKALISLLQAQNKRLEAENECIKTELSGCADACKMLHTEKRELKEKYETTPERALKAVMENFEIGFNGDGACISISTINGNIASTDFMGPCCGTFTLTAEDINTDD